MTKRILAAALLPLFLNVSAYADEVKMKYRMPALMMVTWAEWPEEPEQQDVMAQFIRSQGFNSVEVEVDKLEMCRLMCVVNSQHDLDKQLRGWWSLFLSNSMEPILILFVSLNSWRSCVNVLRL